jgi:hypothetical protein
MVVARASKGMRKFTIQDLIPGLTLQEMMYFVKSVDATPRLMGFSGDVIPNQVLNLIQDLSISGSRFRREVRVMGNKNV